MVKGIKKAKLQKRTSRKQNFKNFIESGYTNHAAFLAACKNDENLLIYTCLTKDELQECIDKMKEFETPEEQIKYLVDHQPPMNSSVERFDRATDSITKYLKGYIEYNGYKMANADGDNEDWTAEFWAKYCKICDFYRTRWFFPQNLKKPTSVVYSPMLYKEFIFIVRMSITGERKHAAFLATQNQNSSLFKISLDGTIDVDDGEKTLADVVQDEAHSAEVLLETSNMERLIEKALLISKQYPDADKIYDKLKDFYEKQDPIGFDKKTVILGKIFLYKAGLISPKVLAFVKALSPTYKARYNISQHRVLAQIKDIKNTIPARSSSHKKKNTNEGWRELILRKRGEL